MTTSVSPTQAASSSPRFNKLKRVLEELFQFDQAELDFGIYRIMNAKRDELTRFLDVDLLPQVQTELSKLAGGNRAEIEAKLKVETENTLRYGGDPEKSQPVQELRRQLAAAADLGAIETDIYNDLAGFFKRYYQNGDFLSLRRYKKDVYAIPYEGEEVKLHWANADQYYVKSSEAFRDYTFTLPAANGNEDRRVHFKLADADTDANNNKAETGKERRFILAEPPLLEEDGELTVRFTYRVSGEKQAKLNADAASTVLTQEGFDDWLTALKDPRPTEKDRTRTLLDKQLADYTAKNSFDYFIHKDLRGFLRRELDFFIKGEVLQLDDLETEGETRVLAQLARVRAMRGVAHKIIEMLAQLENFQKKLWLKKKFVVSTDYCVTLDKIIENVPELLDEVAGNEAQHREWVQLFAIDELGGYSEPLTREFLEANPFLVLDTQFYGAAFKDKLLSHFDDLDAQMDGLLIKSENFGALNLLQALYKEKVRCVYIDPPFNTDGDGFAYKDSYRHASWLSMMRDRTKLLYTLLTGDGTLYAHIDYEEKERLKLLLDERFHYITEIIWRIGWLSGYKTIAKKFIRNHDTIYQFGKSETTFFQKTYIPYPEGYTRRDGAVPEGNGYPLEDTWNSSDLDQLNSIQIISFSKEKVGDKSLTQKNEALVERMFVSSSEVGDYVLDAFLGSGTSAATAYKMKRKFVGIEMGDNFDKYIMPRMKKVLFGDKYGVSQKYDYPRGGLVKYIHLESYEDALNNLEVRQPTVGEQPLDFSGDDMKGFREDYLLHYMLDVETRCSASLLNIEAFSDPFAYELKIASSSAGETQPTKVDLIETFNYLLGLRVKTTETLQGFKAVTGTNPAGEKVLVIWRNLDEKDNAALDAFFDKQKYNPRDMEFDLIYVNGDNNLQNLRREDETWKVRLIEEEFQRLMFDVRDV